jgi:hypothetical protein
MAREVQARRGPWPEGAGAWQTEAGSMPAEVVARTNRDLARTLQQRDPSRIAISTNVDSYNEATAPDSMIDNDRGPQRSQALFRQQAPKVFGPAQRSGTIKGHPDPLVFPVISRPQSSAAAVGADRRMFNFTGFPKMTNGTFARVVATAGGRVRFIMPNRVVPCVQRTIRREVLFAKRKVGKGGSSHKPKRLTSTSNIGC